MSAFVDERGTVGVIYLDFNKAFVTVLYHVLVDKMRSWSLETEQLGGKITCWVVGLRRVVVNCLTFHECHGGDKSVLSAELQMSPNWDNQSWTTCTIRLQDWGLFSLEMRRLWRHLTACSSSPCNCWRSLMRLSHDLHNGAWWTRNIRHKLKQEMIILDTRKYLAPWEHRSSVTGCPGWLCSFHPWRFLRPDWRKAKAHSLSSWLSLPSAGVWTGELPRFLLTWTILGSCDPAD